MRYLDKMFDKYKEKTDKFGDCLTEMIYKGIMIIGMFLTFIFICVMILFILKWLINNGISGIWNLIINFLKTIWCGVSGC